jgi:two-component system sensor histidine kinase KdpD
MQGRLSASQIQERQTAALYRLTRQLSEVMGAEFLVQTAGRQLVDIFGGEIALYVRDEKEKLQIRYGAASSIGRNAINGVVADWVSSHNRIAGLGTDTLPNGTALFVPLIGSQKTVGVLGVRLEPVDNLQRPELRRLIETCASMIALSLERDQSLLEAQETEVRIQAEQLRNSLLSSVSHDLRTPLAAIAGSGSGLLNGTPPPDSEEGRELLRNMVDESMRLSRLVENLLDMTRLEAGALKPNRQWHVLEELVGSVRLRLQKELGDRPFTVTIEPNFPLLYIDGILLEQVFLNLLENAVRYSPARSPIEIEAHADGREATIRILDEGPGLPVGQEEKIFEKFFRGQVISPDGRRGVGLGLAICRGIIDAHGGKIHAQSRPSGGAEITITLPLEENPPSISTTTSGASG